MRRPSLLLVIAVVLAASACSTNSTGSPPATTAGPPRGTAASGSALGSSAIAPITVPDEFTPVIASEIGAGTFPFLGTDGKYHIAYDLLLTNASPNPATMDRVEVVDAAQPSKVVAAFSGKQLLDPECAYGDCNRLRLAFTAPVTDVVIPPTESRILYVDFSIDSLDAAPKAVLHHFFGVGRAQQTVRESLPFDYLATPVDTSAGTPRVISPPLRGTNWVALNGCCLPGFPHRNTDTAMNGTLHNSQRFAIDWKKTNDNGEFYTGDKTKNESYADYGQDVYAVADGEVIAVLDGVEANAPGVQPSQDPARAASIDLQNADGNHVVLDLGGGVYVMYAHFQQGSLRVKVGDKVKKGDKLALLGNTGNANASHLHFQMMDGPNLLTANPLPYVLDNFVYRGQVPLQAILDADDYLTGTYFGEHLATGEPRTNQFPMSLAIVDFPG